ncbi:MAG: hypothetical protein ACR2L3_03115 [Actinomycetota bacterium]
MTESQAHPRIVPVATFEHPGYLHAALREAKELLLIVSPWVKRAVVDEAFLKELENSLKSGTAVYIGWGMEGLDEEDFDIDREVRVRFERLMKDHPATFFAKRLGNTHAKVLICDSSYIIVTSFNWLSFKEDPSRTFRDERGTWVSVPEYINQQFDVWRSRFSEEPSVGNGPDGTGEKHLSQTTPVPAIDSSIRTAGPTPGQPERDEDSTGKRISERRVQDGVEVSWPQLSGITRIVLEIRDAYDALVQNVEVNPQTRSRTIPNLRGFPQPVKLTWVAHHSSGRVMRRSRVLKYWP